MVYNILWYRFIGWKKNFYPGCWCTPWECCQETNIFTLQNLQWMPHSPFQTLHLPVQSVWRVYLLDLWVVFTIFSTHNVRGPTVLTPGITDSHSHPRTFKLSRKAGTETGPSAHSSHAIAVAWEQNCGMEAVGVRGYSSAELMGSNHGILRPVIEGWLGRQQGGGWCLNSG